MGAAEAAGRASDAPSAIPRVAVDALFAGTAAARARCDAALYQAASTVGFVTVTALPADVAPGAASRAELTRIFFAAEAVRARLWRRKFAPVHANVTAAGSRRSRVPRLTRKASTWARTSPIRRRESTRPIH